MEQTKAYALDGTLAVGAVSYSLWGPYLDLGMHLVTFFLGLAIGVPRAICAALDARDRWEKRRARRTRA